MQALPLAHAGHWVTSLIYLAPVVIVAGFLGLQTWRDRRADRNENSPTKGTP